jgi:hypothetical protein
VPDIFHDKNDSELFSAISNYYRSVQGFYNDGSFLAKTVWPKVMEHIDLRKRDVGLMHGLLNGVLISGGCTILLENENTARELVVAAIRHIDENASMSTGITIGDRFYRAVQDWVQLENEPDSKIVPVINGSTRSIVAMLFGEPWCHLIYDARDKDQTLYGLIESTRPAFIVGQFAVKAYLVEATLPDLQSEDTFSR